MMASAKDLRRAMDLLDRAEPCKDHGRDRLEICLECLETVLCDCQRRICQCWNDE